MSEKKIVIAEKDQVVGEAKEETFIKGYVSNCYALNIREKADINSKVLVVVKEGDELMFVKDYPNEKFYKVKYNNLSGFAMKAYVSDKK